MYAFTEEGVASLIYDLYQLTDEELEAQALSAKTDFKSWLSGKISFDTPQSAYLGAIPNQWFDMIGNNFSIALGHRLPIKLIKPVDIDPGDFSSKIIREDNNTDIVYNSVSGLTVTGSYNIVVELQP